MRKSRYVKGSYNAICDISGMKFKRSQMRKTWDGLLVAKKFWDPKHPQLDIRPRPERISVPDARPRPSDITLQDTPVLYATLVDYSGTEVMVSRELVTYTGSTVTLDPSIVEYS